MAVLVSTGGNPYDLDSFTDTLAYVQNDDIWTKHIASLSQYAGQTINVAFCRSGDGEEVAIDDVEIRISNEPNVTMHGCAIVNVGYANPMTTVLTEGMTPDIHYEWSSVIATAISYSADSAEASFIYAAEGLDTVS